MSREIDDILNIESTPQNQVAQTKKALATVQNNYDMVFNGADGTETDERFNEDFEDIRDNLKSLIGEISDSVQKLSIIALDSEKAAHFSALAQMSTTLLNANKQLLEIYSEKKNYHSKKSGGVNATPPGINVQQAIFTGTTSDLKAWIKQQQLEED